MEVFRAENLEALLRSTPDLALVFAKPDEAVRLTTELAALDDAPPVTMLVGNEPRAHPHTRLFQTLVRAKREWEGTFDAIVDPVAILDNRGFVIRANMGLAQVLDRPIKQIVSQHYTALLGAAAQGRDPIADSLADGAHRTQEAGFASLPGHQQVTTSPITDEDGKPRGLVVIIKDISEQKEQQERLLQSARLADIGQLAAGVAHEINTPLASIALRAESLLKSAEDPRLQAIDSFKNFPRYLKTIDEEIFRCKKIISALLEFSRRRKPEVRETDLNALAERAAELVGHQMRLKQVALSLQLEPGLRSIKADDGQLRQALIALLMNALDATPAGGRVEVRTSSEGDGNLVLSVADTGVGIPRENLDKIFNPFFTTKPTGQGTGLGLAICHGIVASHGGEIRVESEPNHGTRISLVLPGEGAQAT
jgi:signal transduction histidine kinase